MQSDQHIDDFLSKHMMTGPKISYHEFVKGLTMYSIYTAFKMNSGALMFPSFPSGFECFDIYAMLFRSYFLNMKRITLKYLQKRSIGYLFVTHH